VRSLFPWSCFGAFHRLLSFCNSMVRRVDKGYLFLASFLESTDQASSGTDSDWTIDPVDSDNQKPENEIVLWW
jgi:hypothetical protein